MEKNLSLLSRLFRPWATKSLADPGADLFALFGVMPSESGLTISADRALRVPAVKRAMTLISEAAASLPRVVVEASGNGGFKVHQDHDALELLNGSANPWTSGFELIRDLVIDALSEDRGGMVWANRVSGGRVAELVRYRAGLLVVDLDQNTGEPSYRLDNRPQSAADVVHLRPAYGRAPLSLAREAIAVAVAMERHAGNLFTKGARPGGALMFPKGMGEEAVKKSREAWRLTHGADGESGKTAILYDGAEFKPFTFSSTDAQFLENRKFAVLEVARAFGVPPSMLFELDRATWGNTEQLGKEFLTYCLEPWLLSLEAALTRVMFPDGGKFRVRFDRDDMTRADLVTRATAISSLISARVINPNEGRDWLGMQPYQGGEEFTNPHINTAPPGTDQGGRPTKQEAPTNAA